MVKYIPYDPLNPVAIIGESHTIVDGKIRLRHTPVEHSIKISNFTEVASPAALHLNEFACMYSRETAYRESNRIVYFSTAHNGATVAVNYSATGTVVTADDMNEIKAHLDAAAESELMNEVAHNKFSNDILALQKSIATISSTYQLPTASAKTKGGVRIGSGLSMAGEVLYSLVENYTLPTATADKLGGVKVGDGLEIVDGKLNVTISGADYSIASQSAINDMLNNIFGG